MKHRHITSLPCLRAVPRCMKIATRIIHGAHAIDPATGALSVPVHHPSTFAQESVDHFGKYNYGRSGNPTREALEDTIATLEGGAVACAFGSGMAAISSTLLLFAPGDHLVVCEDVYGGVFRILTSIFARWQVTVTFVDATDLGLVAAGITPKTKAVYLELPRIPLLKISDLRGAAALARERGLITIVDNTFMTPYLQRPLALDCDIVLHSGTKFLNGHSDVVCGFAMAADAAMGKRLRSVQNAFGAILGPQDCWLTLRGLKTLKVRMDASQYGAEQVAAWLATRRNVLRVHYPGLPGHPGGRRVSATAGRRPGRGAFVRTGLRNSDASAPGGHRACRLRGESWRGREHPFLAGENVTRRDAVRRARRPRDRGQPHTPLGRSGRARTTWFRAGIDRLIGRERGYNLSGGFLDPGFHRGDGSWTPGFPPG